MREGEEQTTISAGSQSTEETQGSDVLHTVATTLGTAIKGLHGVGKHVPHLLHNIESCAEVASEVLHDNISADSVENIVCGTLAGLTKVGVGIAAGVGLALCPEVEVPVVSGMGVGVSALLEATTIGTIGNTAQKLVDSVTQPAAEAVSTVCHAAFDYCKKDSSVFSDAATVLRSLEPKSQKKNPDPVKKQAPKFEESRTSKALCGQTQTDFSRPYLGSKSTSGLAMNVTQNVQTTSQQPHERANKLSPVHGEELTASLNRPVTVNRGKLLEQIKKYCSELGQEQSQRLVHRMLPHEDLFELSAQTKAHLIKNLPDFIANAIAKNLQVNPIEARDQAAYAKRFMASLLGESAEPEMEASVAFTAEFAEQIKTNQEYQELAAAYRKITPSKWQSMSPNSVKEAEQYAYATSIFLHEMGHHKAAAVVSKIGGGLACTMPLSNAVSAGTAVSGGTIALGAVGALVVMHGLLEGIGILDNEEEEGSTQLACELNVIKSLMMEVLKHTILIYNRMIKEFSLINEKMDKYHLEQLIRLHQLFQHQSKGADEILHALQENATKILQEIQEIKRTLPNILQAIYSSANDQLAQHIATQLEFRSLHLQPDRRMVTRVNARCNTLKAIQQAMGSSEYSQLAHELYLATTEETKQENLIGKNLAAPLKSTDSDALQAQQLALSNHSVANAAYAIDVLRRVAVQEGWMKDNEVDAGKTVLGNPLLMTDRVLSYIALHRFYQSQEAAEPVQATEIIHEINQTLASLNMLNEFYENIDPKKLITGLLDNYEKAVLDLDQAVNAEIKVFHKTYVQANLQSMKRNILSDKASLNLHAKHPLNFAHDDSWTTFYHQFEKHHFPWTLVHGWSHPHIGWHYYTGKLWGVFPSYPDPTCTSHDRVQLMEDESVTLSELVRQGRGSVKDVESYWESCNGEASVAPDRWSPLKDAWNSINLDCLGLPDLSRERAFVRVALMQNKKSHLSENKLVLLVRELRQNPSKENYQVSSKALYAKHQEMAQVSLNAAAETILSMDQRFNIWSSLTVTDARIEKLPVRLMKPKASSILTQQFLVDLNDWKTIHANVKMLEWSGQGRIELTYDVTVLKETQLNRRVRFTLSVDFVCHDQFKTEIPLDAASIEEDVSNIYELDEVAYNLFHGERFASGEVIDLSSDEVTNTRPVLIKSSHTPVLDLLRPSLSQCKSLEGKLQDVLLEARKKCSQQIAEAIQTKGHALYNAAQKLEIAAGFLSAYINLLQSHESEKMLGALRPFSTRMLIELLGVCAHTNKKYPHDENFIHEFRKLKSNFSEFRVRYLAADVPEKFINSTLRNLISQLEVLASVISKNSIAKQKVVISKTVLDDGEVTDDEEIDVLEQITRDYFHDNEIEQDEEVVQLWCKPDNEHYKPGERILPKEYLSSSKQRVVFFNYLETKKHYPVQKRKISGEIQRIVQTKPVNLCS